MQSSKRRRDKQAHSRKDNKLSKLVKHDSESEGAESEHELSHYLNDRVKLMKEVLKIIKPKKIRVMAPDCMQRLDNEEINSMLLDELLGISNKRLRYIFSGQNLNEESSSTDPEEEQSVDVISLDDISDEDFVIDLDSDKESRRKHPKKVKTRVKEEPRRKRVKKEKADKKQAHENSQDPSKNQMSEQNLMSVLELLELQARARAIRSQLALESSKKAEESVKVSAEVVSSDNEDAVIVESPENEEIVITSSDSENENSRCNGQQEQNHVFRRSTDDCPESNSVEAEVIREGFNTNDQAVEKSSHKSTEKTSVDNEINSDKPNDANPHQMEKSPVKANEISGNNDSTNGKEVTVVENIPLPKEQESNDAPSSSLKKKTTGDDLSQENNNSKNDNLETSTSSSQEMNATAEKDLTSQGEDIAAESSSDANFKRDIETKKEKKEKSSRVCRRKLAKRKVMDAEDKEKKSSTKSKNKNSSKSEQKDGISCNNDQEKNIKIDECEGIILNVDQAEMDCINLD